MADFVKLFPIPKNVFGTNVSKDQKVWQVNDKQHAEQLDSVPQDNENNKFHTRTVSHLHNVWPKQHAETWVLEKGQYMQ